MLSGKKLLSTSDKYLPTVSSDIDFSGMTKIQIDELTDRIRSQYARVYYRANRSKQNKYQQKVRDKAVKERENDLKGFGRRPLRTEWWNISQLQSLNADTKFLCACQLILDTQCGLAGAK